MAEFTPPDEQPEQPDHQQPPQPPPGEPSQGPQQPAERTPPPAPVTPPAAQPVERRRGSRFLRAVFTSFLILSILLNVYLLIVVAAQFAGRFEQTVIRQGDESETIAVYQVRGIIDGDAADRFLSFYREIDGDENVQAVVLRVESPGGGLTASDQMYQIVRQLQSDGKKVVVSMGAVAASGGYYISAPADEIVAEPTTTTGSIGVLMEWFVLKGTLEKLGVEPVVMKADDARAWKDEISIFETPDPHHRAHLQEVLNRMQKRFETIVRSGRGTRLRTTTSRRTLTVGEGDEARRVTITETEPLNGKIYLAQKALDFGLIDRIGYQRRAVQRAQSLAKLKNPHVVLYEVRQSVMSQLLGRGQRPGVLIEPETLDRLRTPRMLLLWKAE
jgi:protease-4